MSGIRATQRRRSLFSNHYRPDWSTTSHQRYSTLRYLTRWIVTELWYEPAAAPPTPGAASASASGIRRPREPEPHGEKREREAQREPAGSPAAKARIDRGKNRKAVGGEREDEAERTRDTQSVEMALESLA